MGDWPWPLSAYEEWMKSFRAVVFDRLLLRGDGIDTWIGRIWDLVENRFFHQGEGLDTWIGRIYDEFKDHLTLEGEGLDTWIRRYYDNLVNFYQNIANQVTATRNTILTRLVDVSAEVQRSIDALDFSVDLSSIPPAVVGAIIVSVNAGLLTLKEALE